LRDVLLWSLIWSFMYPGANQMWWGGHVIAVWQDIIAFHTVNSVTVTSGELQLTYVTRFVSCVNAW
jgi:hypothetical protein